VVGSSGGHLDGNPQLRTHEGHEWLDVLAGELRLILIDRGSSAD
jgi:hypothetical protein